MQQVVHEAPRTHYGPRTLIDAGHGRYGKARVYGKTPEAPRGDIALPEAWSVVCPNRIAERRRAAGMKRVTQLQRAIGSISYQRLVRMETGRVIIRESEYELVADALGLEESDLKLPVLTHSETVEWNGKWGPGKQIEEGGDEDSVILAAYVRRLIADTGRARTAVCAGFGMPENCLAGIWYAEKPIDRWPDTTMAVVIRLAKVATWDDVIMASRAMHDDSALDDEIVQVMKPRIRYAPEDPDRKAPWTFVTDPLRTRKRRRQAQTPLSAAPMVEKAVDRKSRERRETMLARQQARRDEEEHLRGVYRTVIEEARQGDQVAMLERLFPHDTPVQIAKALVDPETAATIIARAALSRMADSEPEYEMAGEALGVSGTRLRQIARDDDGRISSFMPRTRIGLKGMNS